MKETQAEIITASFLSLMGLVSYSVFTKKLSVQNIVVSSSSVKQVIWQIFGKLILILIGNSDSLDVASAFADFT